MARRDQPPQQTGVPRGAVELPPGRLPYVAPGVDPSKLTGSAAYAAGIAGRRGSGARVAQPNFDLEQKRPPIPLLTGQPERGDSGHTLADYARRERASQAAPPPGQPSIISEAPAPAHGAPTVGQLGLQMGDTLPDGVEQDPAYLNGPGARLAVNQPALAAKYGVLRNGQFIPPQQLGGGRKGLSPQSVAGLKALSDMQSGSGAPGLDQSDEDAEQAVSAGLGGAAGRAGNLPGDKSTAAASKEEVDKKLRQAIDQMDAFEFNEWRQLTMREMLNSEDQRKVIEGRLKPLSIDQVLSAGLIKQIVPIIPGKYELELQSFDGQMDLSLKRLVMSEAKSTEVTEQYLLDKYSFMSAALGLYRVNDKIFPDVTDENGDFNDALFYARFNKVMKLPIHMLASIGVNIMWFEMRVRKLFRAETVGNG